jgi:hypothetical protein
LGIGTIRLNGGILDVVVSLSMTALSAQGVIMDGLINANLESR